MDIAGHSQLKKTNLAKKLRSTLDRNNSTHLYKCLYPGNLTREETFDKFVNSG